MKTNVYEMVTNRIIEQLEKEVIPWQRPWQGSNKGAYNRISNKPYSLLNQMTLQHTGEYATFKQWTDLGGHIRKGEKAEQIVFWKLQPIEEENEDGEKVIRQIPILKYFNVFHISQVDGVEPKEKLEMNEHESIEEAEKIKVDYMNREHLQIRETISDKAFYLPTADYIQVPCKEQYQNIEEFYSTLFHEIVHSTGHKSRLDRKDIKELGSAFLINMLDIETEKSFKNSSAYIQSWLRVLKNDTHFIVSASSRAEKAVKYILNEQ